jgi:hypothetical protein
MTKQNRPSVPAYAVGTPSAFLAECLREASNVELDWLWAAAKVNDSSERRYCLERALYINPDNHATRRALSKLNAKRRPADISPSVRVKRIQLLGS